MAREARTRLERVGAGCASLSTRHPKLVIAAFALLLVTAVIPASRVGFDASAESWFARDDPARVAYRQVRELFGSDEFVLALLEAESDSVFTNDTLASVDRVTRTVEKLDFVTDVQSLTNVELLRGDGDAVVIEHAISPAPLSAPELASARRRVLDEPLAARGVLAAGERVATLVIHFDPGEDAFRNRWGLIDEIEASLEAERLTHGNRYRLMGDAVLQRDLFHKVQRDLIWNFPVALLAVLGLLWLAFRSLLAVGLAAAVVLVSLAVTRGVQGLLGWNDNSILSITPIVLLVTGVADSVHVLDRYFENRGGAEPPRDAVRTTLSELFRPCLLTSLTTVLGFVSLTTSPLFPLRQLGTLAAIGVATAFAASVLLLPAALALLAPSARHDRPYFQSTQAGLARIPLFVRRWRRTVLGIAATTTLVAVAGLTRIEVESDYLELFWPSDPVRIEAEWVEMQVGGIVGLEAVVTADAPGALLEPTNLRAVDNLATRIESLAATRGTTSFADYLRSLDRAMRTHPEPGQIPETRALAAQYLLLYDLASGGALSSYIDPTHTRGRIWTRMQLQSSSAFDAMAEPLERWIERNVPSDLSVQLTGGVVLFKNMGEYIVQSQLRSFAAALALVTLCMGVAFRSIRIAFLSLIPNVWPILLCLGFMGWAGWWLQPGTAMVAAVVLGIAVDDTIHFLDGYIDSRRSGLRRSEAVVQMVARAGRAVAITTLVLVTGFAVTLFSQLRDTVLFGALCIVALSFALVGDLLVLPALLQRGADEPRPQGN